MILCGVTTDTSVGKLLTGGIVPGALMALVFVLRATFRAAPAPDMHGEQMAGAAEMARAPRRSARAGTPPVFGPGGMYLGVFTAGA